MILPLQLKTPLERRMQKGRIDFLEVRGKTAVLTDQLLPAVAERLQGFGFLPGLDERLAALGNWQSNSYTLGSLFGSLPAPPINCTLGGQGGLHLILKERGEFLLRAVFQTTELLCCFSRRRFHKSK